MSVQAELLDKAVLRELATLPEGMAQRVGRHLAAAGLLLDEDAQLALEHAQFAYELAPRLAVVREAVGIASYRCQRYAEALSHLRAVRRLNGRPDILPLLADLERALGRPQKALDLAGSAEADQLDETGKIEMRIVAAGARRDLNQAPAAVLTLQIPALHKEDFSLDDPDAPLPRGAAPRLHASTVARLRYAYADALLATGEREQALAWFLRAEQADVDEDTDAAAMVDQLSQEGVIAPQPS